MGIEKDLPLYDTEERPDFSSLSAELSDAFNTYYKIQKERIERRKKDLATLKKRANIKDSSTPATVSSILPYIYK